LNDYKMLTDCSTETTASRTPHSHCEICDWPLAESAANGCVPGNCSYRPEEHSQEWRRILERKSKLKSAASLKLDGDIFQALLWEFQRLGTFPESVAIECNSAPRELRLGFSGTYRERGWRIAWMLSCEALETVYLSPETLLLESARMMARETRSMIDAEEEKHQKLGTYQGRHTA
jgi:hypothetical protein